MLTREIYATVSLYTSQMTHEQVWYVKLAVVMLCKVLILEAL